MTDEHSRRHHDPTSADPHDPTSPQVRTEALELLLREAGLVTEDAIDRIVRRFEEDVGPMRGARVVARAWVDDGFRSRLLEDGNAALDEMGFAGGQTEHLVVKANDETVHNVVVCTLCSCYPWAVLGLPPTWYKEPAYRSRVVREPRSVLREMGLEVPAGRELRVWDSTAEVRYMVLPEVPPGVAGWDEDRLADLVTRDAMIGVGVVEAPRTESGGSGSD